MPSTTAIISHLKDTVAEGVDRSAQTLITLSHRIHADPEPAFQEHRAVAAITATAAELGLEVHSGAYGIDTALRADFGAGAPGVAIMAEYDALPGSGHACGHNVIAAIGLGAATTLHELRAELAGRVRFLGTPAEESGCGKELLAEAGAFDDLDAAMMVHPASWDLQALNGVCLSQLEVGFTGRASHSGIAPEQGRNALDAAVLAHQAIGMLAKHLAAAERVHGIITEGGDTPSIVPARVAARYYLRAADPAALAQLKHRVEDCIAGAARAAGCSAAIDFAHPDYLDLRTNPPLAAAYQANTQRLGRAFTSYETFPAAVTDAGNISHRIPVLHPTIACAPTHVMIHDAEFAHYAVSAAADQAVIDGAKALAMTVIDYLHDSTLRERISVAHTR
ncbi:M20 family metallopeptidase [Nocardia yamanashiensis]|uniref:M20 family metallopeptidase n=1 Tax=Nocardia yamanashiensis TaxID=209247 RepID=UPI00082B05D7|nr:M20 family metallopeptidase [Nocardia yamanashiensis]